MTANFTGLKITAIKAEALTGEQLANIPQQLQHKIIFTEGSGLSDTANQQFTKPKVVPWLPEGDFAGRNEVAEEETYFGCGADLLVAEEPKNPANPYTLNM